MLIICFLFFSSGVLHAQTVQWAHSFGSSGSESVSQICHDAAGNVYIAGTHGGSVDFDPGPGVLILPITSGLGQDVFVVKLDPSGNLVWAISFAGDNYDGPGGIYTNAAQEVFITLHYAGNIDLDPGPGTANATSVDDEDFAIVKLDAAGQYIWSKTIGGTYGQIPTSLKLDGLGNIVISGRYSGSADFDPGPGTFTLSTSALLYTIFILKLDPAGNFTWARSIGGNADEKAFSVAIDGSNNIYTTGIFNGTIDFDPGPAIQNFTAVGSTDVFINKLDASGNFVWNKTFGSNTLDVGNSISIGPGNSVYCAGNFRSTADFDPGPGTYNLVSGGDEAGFVLKLDSAGNFLWADKIGASAVSNGGNARTIEATNDGGAYVTGYFVGTVDFDPGPATLNVTSLSSSEDIYVVKLTSSGALQWTQRYGGVGSDAGHLLTAGPYNGVYLAGTYGSIPASFGSYSLSAAGMFDIYVCRINPPCTPSSSIQNVSACGSYSWAANGTTYTASGTYNTTIPNAAGCDSNITLNLTIRQHTSATQTVNTCGSYTWPVNGTTYTSSGTYSATIPNAAGCDSNITLNLTLRQHTSATQTVNTCGSYTWPVNGTTYTSSGTYNAAIPNAAGCDSNITLILILRQNTSATQTVNTCGSYTWPVNGTTYTSSGTYNATIPNAAGCDSNITLILTIRQHTSATQTMSACGSYTWPVNGNTYTSSGTYNATIPNAAGCDSNITLILTIRQHTSATQTVNTCGSYTWPVNGTTYTASGTYNATIPNAAGCDSNITLNLTIRQHTSATQTMSACGSYTWPVNGTTYTSSGTYNATIPNAAGCDSNITLNLTIRQHTSATQTVSACGSYTWPVNGTTYTSSGTYNATIPNAAGCDSNITLNLILRQHTSATQTMSACGSYTWPVNGTTYTASGTYNATIPNAAGCDSNITLNLTINTIDNSVVQQNDSTLTAQASGVTYQWIDCLNGNPLPGETNATFVASVNGSYAVILDDNGCTDTSDCIVISNLDIPWISPDPASVYPNPSAGIFTWRSGSATASGMLYLYTVTGARVMEIPVNGQSTLTVDASGVPAGTYVLEWITANNMVRCRIVIARP